ncbi:hypothetical protein [Solidesulfovibrio magneticus]|uniref:hypothetical protein n=1 Tax=Solidesulfovibrio magneticus TaxID=184917 RepID=UPI0005BBA5EB|nr:hypothetical protein [Solidesulfovibrio magneticus]
MSNPYAGTMTIGGGATLSYISVDGKSVVVSATVGGVLQGAATLDAANASAKLCNQGMPGSGVPSVEVAFALAAQVTLSWTLSWAGMPSGSTSSGILAGWPV